MNGKPFIAAGVTLIVFGLLAFGLSTPTTTIGQETDVAVEDDGSDVGNGVVGPDDEAAPPASLPNTGTGSAASVSSLKLTLFAVLGGIGLALVAGGVITSRRAGREPAR